MKSLEHVAVNLADLTRYDAIVRSCMIAPVVSASDPVVKTGPNLDDASVVLQCEPARAVAIVRFLQDIDGKAKRYPLRAYQQGIRGGWSKLPFLVAQ